MRRLTADILLISIIITSFSLTGCRRTVTRRLVPIEEIEPMWRREFAEGGVVMTASIYTKGFFHIVLRNDIAGFRLKEKPAVVSDTGTIVVPATRYENEFSFNFIPEGEKVISRIDDIAIEWNLIETGEDGFLISRKRIAIDVAYSSGNYYVISMTVTPVRDME